eukprot:579062-Amphidinium_carterae.2
MTQGQNNAPSSLSPGLSHVSGISVQGCAFARPAAVINPVAYPGVASTSPMSQHPSQHQHQTHPGARGQDFFGRTAINTWGVQAVTLWAKLWQTAVSHARPEHAKRTMLTPARALQMTTFNPGFRMTPPLSMAEAYIKSDVFTQKWVSTRTRPDLAYAVSTAASVLTLDLRELDQRLVHLLQYLAGNPDHGLVYGFLRSPRDGKESPQMTTYSGPHVGEGLSRVF